MGILFSASGKDNTAVYDRKKILTIASGLGYSHVDVKRLRIFFTKAGITPEQELYVSDFITAYDFENATFIQLMLSIFDLDSTGFVSFEEFLISLWNALTLDPDMLFAFVYNCFDKHHLGKLSIHEVKRMISIVTNNDYNSMMLISSLVEEKQDVQGNISFIVLRDYLSHDHKSHREILSPMIEQQRVMRIKLLGSKRWMTLSVQRQVLFRSQHLHDILGLLAYNPSTNGSTGYSKQKQTPMKKPEPSSSMNSSVMTGSKTSQIHVDGIKEEEKQNGDVCSVREGSIDTRGSDGGSFCSTINDVGVTMQLIAAKAALAALTQDISGHGSELDTASQQPITSSQKLDAFPGPNVPISFPHKHQRMISTHMDKAMLADGKRTRRAKAQSFSSYGDIKNVSYGQDNSSKGLSGNTPLDRALSLRPNIVNIKGVKGLTIDTNETTERPSQNSQSNITAFSQSQSNVTTPLVFDEVYELPGAMFDSTDILASTNSSGVNTPVNRRSSTGSRRGSILSVLGGGGSGYRTPPTDQGLDLKASILLNLQNEKAMKRKAKQVSRRTFG